MKINTSLPYLYIKLFKISLCMVQYLRNRSGPSSLTVMTVRSVSSLIGSAAS